MFLNNFEDEGEEIKDEDVPQKVKAEYTRPGKVARHIEDHLQRHFRHVATEAMNYLIKRRINQIDGVIVGGHKEYLHQIEQYLPTKLKSKLAGDFISDVSLPLDVLTQKAQQVIFQG